MKGLRILQFLLTLFAAAKQPPGNTPRDYKEHLLAVIAVASRRILTAFLLARPSLDRDRAHADFWIGAVPSVATPSRSSGKISRNRNPNNHRTESQTS
jgi:hypothetical protein